MPQPSRIKISTLDPAPFNPRVSLTPDDPEWRELKQSMDDFGLVQQIVVNRPNRRILGGHQKLAILKSEGRKFLEPDEVRWVDLPEPDQKRLCLAMNNITGRWADDLLSKILAELAADEGLGGTGFSDEDAIELIEKVKAQEALAGSSPTAAAAAGRASTVSDYVTITYTVTGPDRKIVTEACSKAKADLGADNANEALVAICRAYLDG